MSLFHILKSLLQTWFLRNKSFPNYRKRYEVSFWLMHKFVFSLLMNIFSLYWSLVNKRGQYPVPHPTHSWPAPPQNTLLTVNLPHRGTPYSLWTCPTAEHLSHLWPSPPWNKLLTLDLPHRGTRYSPRTCPTAEHPTHRGPAPPPNTLLTLDLPSLNERRLSEKIAPDDTTNIHRDF